MASCWFEFFDLLKLVFLQGKQSDIYFSKYDSPNPTVAVKLKFAAAVMRSESFESKKAKLFREKFVSYKLKDYINLSGSEGRFQVTVELPRKK